jgi:hypothetical protein
MNPLIILLVLPIISFSQNECKYINPDKVTWSDFKGRIDYSKTTDATTSTKFIYKLVSDTTATRLSKAEIGVVFCRDLSWVNNSKIADKKLWDRLLDHEKLHLKQKMVNAKKFKKSLLALRSMKLSQSVLQKLINDFDASDKKDTDKYDAETKHGRIEQSQNKWKAKIEKDYNDLKTIKLIGE